MVLAFPFVSEGIFSFLLWFIPWPNECSVTYLVSTCLSFFQFSYNYFLVLYHCGHKRYLIWFQSSWIYWVLVCYLTCDLFWRMLHVHLIRIHIRQFGDGIFYNNLWGPSGFVLLMYFFRFHTQVKSYGTSLSLIWFI